MDGDLDAFGDLEPKLPHDRAGFADGARAVVEALIPVGRASQDGPRVAGAQGADDQVVYLRRVLDRDELDRAGGVYAEFECRRLRVGEETGLELLVYPGPDHEPRSVGRRAGLHVLDLASHVLSGQDAFLDQELFDCPDTRGVVRGLRVRLYALVVVLFEFLVLVVARVVHVVSWWAGSSQCS